jgi:glycosyltransferase involved in cell wall biosynthesis
VNRVLLTVSGTMDPERPEQVSRGERPRADYLELAAALGADLLDHAGARRLARNGPMARLIYRLGGPHLLLAWACFLQRKQYDLIFSDGEQVGIPLAWLLKFFGSRRQRQPERAGSPRPDKPGHVMIAHILSVGKKAVFFDLFRVHSHIDLFFVYSSWQARHLTGRWRVPAERVVLTPFMVDARFFALEQVAPRPPQDRPRICAVGLEHRDYPTLLAAVRGLPVDVVIAAASPWSKRSDTTAGQEIPPNVTVRRFNQYDLRQLYADSAFLVMPLYDVSFQAGVTAILEAMSMSRAVICSRTAGQTDVIVDGETGVYVPPGNVQALRAAIEDLLARPEDANPQDGGRMGRAGRRLVEQEMNLDVYVQRLTGCARAVLQSGPPAEHPSDRHELEEAR